MCLVCQNSINSTVTLLKICPNVTETQLFELHLSGRLDNLRKLNCWGTGLQTLPLFPNLWELECGWCDSLKTIPLLPDLQKLLCKGCTNLQTIPLFPNLQELDCEDCIGLQTLPLFPNLRELYCQNCTGLQTLPLFPNLQKLDCGGCRTRLQTLLLFPNLRELYYDSCTSFQYSYMYHRTWTNEAFRKGMYALCHVWKTWSARRKRIKSVLPLPKVLLGIIN